MNRQSATTAILFSKSKVRFIRSLQQKKFRKESGRFVIEGKKCVLELLHADYPVETIVCSKSFFVDHKEILSRKKSEMIVCAPKELQAVSSLKTNEDVLAVVRKKTQPLVPKLKGLTLVLDDIQDPGNVGTIVRIADWFGLCEVIVSPQTADLYNPKTLQSSMGSFIRVSVLRAPLEKLLTEVPIPIYASGTEGDSLHSFPFEEDVLVILGNESNGVSRTLRSFASRTISIPGQGGAESLNVAGAAAVICDNYRRIRNKI